METGPWMKMYWPTKNGGWDFPKRQPCKRWTPGVFRGKTPRSPEPIQLEDPLGWCFPSMGLVVYLLRTVTWMVLIFMAWKCREIYRRHGWLMMVDGSEIRHSLTSWGKGSWNSMIYSGFGTIPGGCLGFCPSTVWYRFIYDIQIETNRPIHVNIYIYVLGGC